MHLRCPPESYDVNIEPAKDDLLFSNTPEVMSLVDAFFRQYYGELSSSALVERRSVHKDKAVPVLDQGFDILLANKSPMPPGKAASSRQIHSNPDLVEIEIDSTLRDEDLTGDVQHLTSPGQVAFEQQTPGNQDGSGAPGLIADEARKAPVSDSRNNMYGVDDEDLMDLGSPPPTQDSNADAHEEDGLRNARVTNPWSLARLHAPTRQKVAQLQVLGSPDVQTQLMTPGPGQNGSTEWRPSAIQGVSASHQLFLPSLATSSPSPAGYQNPGPPLRRRPYHEREEQGNDDSQFTQDVVPESSQRRQATSLDTWVRPYEATGQLPAFQRASNIYNKDGIYRPLPKASFQCRGGGLGGSPSNQLTELPEMAPESRVSSGGVTKPFRSPIRASNNAPQSSHINLTTPNTMIGSDVIYGISNLPLYGPSSIQSRPSQANLDSLRQQMPPPPSPTQRPFKASQSPNPELADILEFEQRKKAVVTQQRKLQSKFPLGELDPAKLAHMQRKSNDFSGPWTQSSKMKKALSNLDLREEESNPAKDFARGFAGPEEEEHSTAAAHNSPHKNRYLAARQRLSHAHPEIGFLQHVGDGHAGAETLRGTAWGESDGAEVRLSENDPRAYLIRHRANDSKSNGNTELTKTDLKIRRTKTARLPLETISPEMALHELRATVKDPFLTLLTSDELCRCQSKSDDYVKTGENTFVIWSVNSRDVKAWEAKVNELISSNFKTKLANGEVVIPEVTMALTTAIKAHTDAHGW